LRSTVSRMGDLTCQCSLLIAVADEDLSSKPFFAGLVTCNVQPILFVQTIDSLIYHRHEQRTNLRHGLGGT
jgi:hypothetical protein